VIQKRDKLLEQDKHAKMNFGPFSKKSPKKLYIPPPQASLKKNVSSES
jgi:hypothetical protein